MPSPTNNITFFALPDSVTTSLLACCVAASFVCASPYHALVVRVASCSLVSDVAGALHTKFEEVTSSLSSTPLPFVSTPVWVSTPPLTHCSEPTAMVLSTARILFSSLSSSLQPASATITAKESTVNLFMLAAIIAELVQELD